MNPERCDFLAGDQLIQIVPRLNEPVLHLISGDVGPLEAGVPVAIPMWLAILLRRRHHCHIVPPDWLCVEELKRLLSVETDMSGLARLPFAFFETAYSLTREAREDVSDGDQLKSLIQDLWDKREAKLRTSSLKFVSQHNISHARMDSVQSLEAAGPVVKSTLAACTKVAQLVTVAQDKHQD